MAMDYKRYGTAWSRDPQHSSLSFHSFIQFFLFILFYCCVNTYFRFLSFLSILIFSYYSFLPWVIWYRNHFQNGGSTGNWKINYKNKILSFILRMLENKTVIIHSNNISWCYLYYSVKVKRRFQYFMMLPVLFCEGSTSVSMAKLSLGSEISRLSVSSIL